MDLTQTGVTTMGTVIRLTMVMGMTERAGDWRGLCVSWREGISLPSSLYRNNSSYISDWWVMLFGHDFKHLGKHFCRQFSTRHA